MIRHLKPTGGFELLAWFFMRISGLILVFLALGHLLITHILNNVETVNYEFVVNRWGDPHTGVFWRLWDLTMINLAVLHGGNGLRQVLDEYVHRPGRRVLTGTLIWCGAIFLMMIGTYAILMFEKDQGYLNQRRANRQLGELVQRRRAALPPSSAPAPMPAGLATMPSPE